MTARADRALEAVRMGRLHATRARLAASVVFLVVAPLLAVVASRLVTTSGVPAVGFTVAAAVAYLLCVGPRGGALVVVAHVVDGIVVRGAPPSVGLVVVAGLQAGVAVAVALLLERRMAHHGRVRRPTVAIEYAVIAAALLPALHHAVPTLLGAALAGSGGAHCRCRPRPSRTGSASCCSHRACGCS